MSLCRACELAHGEYRPADVGSVSVLTFLSVIPTVSLTMNAIDDTADRVSPPSDKIVILVHGWWNSPSNLSNLADLLREKFPSWSIDNTFDYSTRAGLLSTSDPELVARDLANHIQRVATEHPTRPIIIVGHSIGGFLARRTFLIAASSSEWTRRIERMVLLSAPNAGWAFRRRNSATSDRTTGRAR